MYTPCVEVNEPSVGEVLLRGISATGSLGYMVLDILAGYASVYSFVLFKVSLEDTAPKRDEN